MATNLAQETAEACFDAFAETVTLAGTEVDGIPDNELVSVPGYDGLVEPRSTLALRKADVPDLQKGQSVIIRGQTYQVDQTMPGQSDFDVLVKVLLR